MRPTQPGLFDAPSLYIVADLKAAMNGAARECGLSREQILDRMNELGERYGIKLVNGNGRKLSLETLEKWLNPQETGRVIPLKSLPIFCAAVKDHSSIGVMARPLGLRVIGPKEIAQLEWAKANLKAKAARKRMKQLEEVLDEPEISGT